MAKKILRKVCASKGSKKQRIVSLLPIDRAGCKCQEDIVEMKKKLEVVMYTCPKSKEKGMKKYLITCGECGADIAYIYAKDENLSDWCDLHYITENTGKEWKGCMAVNISPVDGRLGFECTCGNDTRDFRTNTTMPSKLALEIAKENLIGREFGKRNSKFKTKEVKK